MIRYTSRIFSKFINERENDEDKLTLDLYLSIIEKVECKLSLLIEIDRIKDRK